MLSQAVYRRRLHGLHFEPGPLAGGSKQAAVYGAVQEGDERGRDGGEQITFTSPPGK